MDFEQKNQVHISLEHLRNIIEVAEGAIEGNETLTPIVRITKTAARQKHVSQDNVDIHLLSFYPDSEPTYIGK